MQTLRMGSASRPVVRGKSSSCCLDASRKAGVEAEGILSAARPALPCGARRGREGPRPPDDTLSRVAGRLLEASDRILPAVVRLRIEEAFEGQRGAGGRGTCSARAAPGSRTSRSRPWPRRSCAGSESVAVKPERMLDLVPHTEEMRLKIRVCCCQWRSSDRLLFPAPEVVERVGMPEEKDWVLEKHRKRRADKLFSRRRAGRGLLTCPSATRVTWGEAEGENHAGRARPQDRHSADHPARPRTGRSSRERRIPLGEAQAGERAEAGGVAVAPHHARAVRRGRRRREGVVGPGTEVAITSGSGRARTGSSVTASSISATR